MILGGSKRGCNCAIDEHLWIIDALCDSSRAVEQKDLKALRKNTEEMETGLTRITKCLGREAKDYGLKVELIIFRELLEQADRDERWTEQMRKSLRSIQSEYFSLISIECGVREPRPTPGGYIG